MMHHDLVMSIFSIDGQGDGWAGRIPGQKILDIQVDHWANELLTAVAQVFVHKTFDMARKHSKEKWTACPPVGVSTTSEMVRFVFLSNGAKSSGRIWKGFPLFFGVAMWAKMDSQKRNKNLFSIRWAEKLRPKMDGISSCSSEQVQLQNWQTFPPRLKKNSENGKHFLLFARGSIDMIPCCS